MPPSSRLRARSALTVLVTLATALALAGCAQDASDTADDSAAPTSSAPPPDSPASDSPAQDSPAQAIADAKEASAADDRPVLLDFGADWCTDCVVLDGLYDDPRVAPILQRHFHLVQIDVGEFDKNLDVAADYVHLETSGIPALVVIKPDGTIAYASNGGEFSHARTMHAPEVAAFLNHWAHAA